ncbi:MAG: FixH family protein [Steroidobacteraceae bacterium]|nr:FixH family protein [Deltaproteobacteria bacterium]
MIQANKTFVIPLTLLALALPCSPLHASSHEGRQTSTSQTGQAPVFAAMPGPGKKVPLENGAYLIYGFDKKLKMGTVIMKVVAYTPNGKQDTSLEVLADSGMPSMRGAHETGDQPFKLSRKGEYLLPVNIVMPGDWEIRITVKKGGKVIFRGSHKFDV